MHYDKLTKPEIAKRQLFQSIELYLAGDDLISVITLAGAAEEILGKLVNHAGKPNALDEKVQKLCKVFELVFKVPAVPKELIKLRNKSRNELKHIGVNGTIEIKLEEEAVKLLDRAINNYKKLNPGSHTLFHEFEKERVRRYRVRNEKSA